MATVNLSQINKFYGATQALFDVSLDIEDGAFVVFVGPSGCGKSTLLRAIAGLEGIDSGAVRIGADDVTDADPADRGVAMVFQSYALFPHMTVRQNMEFGMKVNKVDPAERARRITEAARVLQLTDYLDRKPAQLSGGQRQRVAIGRAIVKSPKVFLFDEPLSNLDAKLRVQMRVELEALHKQLNATMIYVTHDQSTAMTMADKIVVLNGGRIEQVGRGRMDLYPAPPAVVARIHSLPAMNVICALSGAGHCLRLTLDERRSFIGCRPEHVRNRSRRVGPFSTARSRARTSWAARRCFMPALRCAHGRSCAADATTTPNPARPIARDPGASAAPVRTRWRGILTPRACRRPAQHRPGGRGPKSRSSSSISDGVSGRSAR